MMLRGDFRPWGPLEWILDRSSPKTWAILGVIGTEMRSIACWNELRGKGLLQATQMLLIHDEHPSDKPKSRYYDEFERVLGERRAEYLAAGGNENDIREFFMADIHGRIVDAADQFISTCGPNVVVDISSMPKRYFFPILRRLVMAETVTNLIVTYAIPAEYAKAPLAEEPGPKTFLPTFLPPDPEPSDGLLVVGLGFEPLGLRPVVERKECVLLFPYPSLSTGIRRNWDMVRKLSPMTKRPPIRMFIYDVPSMFSQLVSLTNGGTKYATLAPFGPKTMSLAMCLFGIAYSASPSRPSVIYTQPKIYNPHYSSGIAYDDGVARIRSYVVKTQGVSLYRAS